MRFVLLVVVSLVEFGLRWSLVGFLACVYMRPIDRLIGSGLFLHRSALNYLAGS